MIEPSKDENKPFENAEDRQYDFLDNPNDEKTIMNRSFQNAVFCDMFRELPNLLELHRALRPEDKKTKESDIRPVTIRNVLTVQDYNDLGYRVGDDLVCLVEAQSTWQRRMPMRLLSYANDTFIEIAEAEEAYWKESDSYTPPMPDLHVLYSGRRKKNVPSFISMNEIYWKGRCKSLELRGGPFQGRTGRYGLPVYWFYRYLQRAGRPLWSDVNRVGKHDRYLR